MMNLKQLLSNFLLFTIVLYTTNLKAQNWIWVRQKVLV